MKTRGKILAYLAAAVLGAGLAVWAPTTVMLLFFFASVVGVVVTMLAGRR